MLPKPKWVSGPAGPSDPTSLAEFADKISETAKEAHLLCEQILGTLKARDLLVDQTRIIARCAIDAYSLLARQLRDLSSHDEALFKLENEKFWLAFRCVMDLWLENGKKCVDILKRDPRIQPNLAGKLWQSFRASAEFTAFGPPKMQEGTFQDLQFVNALFALCVFSARGASRACADFDIDTERCRKNLSLKTGCAVTSWPAISNGRLRSSECG